MTKAEQYLGLARKAGVLLCGEDASFDAVRAGRAKLVLLAEDVSPAAARRAEKALQGRRAPLCRLPYDKDHLSRLLGRQGCGTLCFTDLALAAVFAAAMAEQLPDWSETARLLADRQEKAERRKAAPRKHPQSGKRRT